MTRPISVLGLRLLPFIFLAVVLGILAFGFIATGQAPASPVKPAAPLPALQVEQARLAGDLDALEKRMATVQVQLGWVLGAVALFTLIQGAFAAFGAYNFVQQADRVLADIKERQKAAADMFTENTGTLASQGAAAVKKIEDLAIDVHRRYPYFDRAEQARRDAFERLAPLIENGDWRENLYEKLTIQQRQGLLSAENFVGLEFLDSSGEIGGNLRLMGNFYASKYVKNGRKDPNDLERAQYYLDLALGRCQRSFHHLNDYGLLLLEITRPGRPDDAEPYFLESRGKTPRHQRAAYNLAGIAHGRGNQQPAKADKLKRYYEAHGLLQDALSYEVWEFSKSEEREGDIHYNMACCLARLSECDETVTPEIHLLKSLDELFAAAKIGGTLPKTLKGDLTDSDGDLLSLAQCGDTKIQRELARIRSVFERVWARKGVAFN
jgi:hypothetical protein